MRYVKALFMCLATTMVFSVPNFFNSSVAQADTKQQTKIALINAREVLTKTTEGEKIVADIQKKFEKSRSELESLQKETQKLDNEVKGSTKHAKYEQLQGNLRKIAELNQKLLQSVNQEESVQFKPLLEKLNTVLTEYAKSHGLSAIQEPVGFVYYDPSLDITREVIKLVNDMK